MKLRCPRCTISISPWIDEAGRARAFCPKCNITVKATAEASDAGFWTLDPTGYPDAPLTGWARWKKASKEQFGIIRFFWGFFSLIVIGSLALWLAFWFYDEYLVK